MRSIRGESMWETMIRTPWAERGCALTSPGDGFLLIDEEEFFPAFLGQALEIPPLWRLWAISWTASRSVLARLRKVLYPSAKRKASSFSRSSRRSQDNFAWSFSFFSRSLVPRSFFSFSFPPGHRSSSSCQHSRAQLKSGSLDQRWTRANSFSRFTVASKLGTISKQGWQMGK